MTYSWKIEQFVNPDISNADIYEWIKAERRATRQAEIPSKAYEQLIYIARLDVTEDDKQSLEIEFLRSYADSVYFAVKYSTDGLWKAAVKVNDAGFPGLLFDFLCTSPEDLCIARGTKESIKKSVSAIDNSCIRLIRAIRTSEIELLDGTLLMDDLTVGGLLEHLDPNSESGYLIPPDSCVNKLPPMNICSDETRRVHELLSSVSLIKLLEYTRRRVALVKNRSDRGHVRGTECKYSDTRSAFIDLLACGFYCNRSSDRSTYPQKEIVDTVDAILAARMPDLVPEKLTCYESAFAASIKRVKRMNSEINQ